MSNIFQKLELAAFRNQITPRTDESRAWFMNNAQLPPFHHGSTDENTPTDFFVSDRGLMNGTGRVAYFPFSAHKPMTTQVSGNISF